MIFRKWGGNIFMGGGNDQERSGSNDFFSKGPEPWTQTQIS